MRPNWTSLVEKSDLNKHSQQTYVIYSFISVSVYKPLNSPANTINRSRDTRNLFGSVVLPSIEVGFFYSVGVGLLYVCNTRYKLFTYSLDRCMGAMKITLFSLLIEQKRAQYLIITRNRFGTLEVTTTIVIYSISFGFMNSISSRLHELDFES